MQVERLVLVPTLACLILVSGCGDDGSDIPALGVESITAVLARSSDARPLKLNHQRLTPIWTVSRDQELSCAGVAVAGGQVGGKGNFTQLGESSVDVSAAWNVGNLIQTTAQYQPVGPAGGPVAPVLGQSEYPYAFSYDPEAGECGQAVEATGKVILTAANGDQVFGDITGGEAHRLDFILNGDGVETFAEVSVTGGTGRFADATGEFVVHTIARMLPTFRFAITLAEILPGATLGY
jgi:hypothetical protein